MVFSSAWLATAARVPAELCQGPPRPGQRRRLRADEVLRALFVPPVQELERIADCLFVFFCLPLPEPEQYYVPASGRGGWMTRRPGLLYSFRRSLSVSSSSSSSSSWTDSEEEGLYYLDD